MNASANTPGALAAASTLATSTTPSIHCNNMGEVRQHIDALDVRIVALLVERTGYMTQAARLKQHATQVHDQARIDFIVAQVRQHATALNGQPDVVEAAYRALMDASIAFEHREFARLHTGASA